jgi:Cys-rich four helix bundle protein (predicted Tat secretion target)
MNRRHLLTSTAALLAADGPALAQSQTQRVHDHPAVGLNPQLVASATACISTGLACINHCFESLVAGDTSLAACARSVDQMSVICSALAKLASTGSRHLASMAKLTLAVCQDCENECRKHADKHATCKACADACADCAVECKKISA